MAMLPSRPVRQPYQTSKTMPINYQQVRNLTAREIENALFRDDFILTRSTGSHRRYYHESANRRVSVSWHSGGQTFKPAALRSIIERQAGWTEADLIRLGLIRD